MDDLNRRELSLYVHIPFCKEKCSYCDFLSFGNCGYRLQRQYIDELKNEIMLYEDISYMYQIKSIFFGGGTPSYIDSAWIVEIMDVIRNTFVLEEDVEITIEGNPDSLSRKHLADYKKAGINRLSIGLQSANSDSLKRLNRVHNYDQFVAAFNSARQAGFDNINVDIMSGLPGEGMEDYVHTLAKVVEMSPEHISAYSLIVEEGTPLSENHTLLEMMPSEELDRQMYGRTKTLLKNCGYCRYEISNYAKPGYECKHNLVYWTGGEYLGLGLGASSYMKVWVSEKECKTIRFHGVENLNEYIGRFSGCEGIKEDSYTGLYHELEDVDSDYDYLYDITENASYNIEQYKQLEDSAFLEFIRDYYRDLYFCKRKDEMEEMMFLGLRLMKGISKKEFYERFLVSIESIYGSVIDKYLKNGMLLEKDGYIALSDAGIDVSNVIMAEFML